MYGSVGELFALRHLRSSYSLSVIVYCLLFCSFLWWLVLFPGTGSGKTMLMDMFYDSVRVAKKKRVHFNGFMLDIHQRE